MHLLISLLLGAIAGFIAGKIMGTDTSSLVKNIICGILGGVIGGALFHTFGLTHFNALGNIIISVVGACIVIWVGRLIFK